MEYTTIDKDLVLSFFLSLSRMEFALKVTGFAIGNEKKVNPDWDRFAKSIIEEHAHNIGAEYVDSISYYLENPPAKQVLIDGRLEWDYSIVENGSDIEKVLILVRRVRNNLFHGGKYNQQMIEETARNNLLLSHGLNILQYARECDDNVRYAFDSSSI